MNNETTGIVIFLLADVFVNYIIDFALIRKIYEYISMSQFLSQFGKPCISIYLNNINNSLEGPSILRIPIIY